VDSSHCTVLPVHYLVDGIWSLSRFGGLLSAPPVLTGQKKSFLARIIVFFRSSHGFCHKLNNDHEADNDDSEAALVVVVYMF